MSTIAKSLASSMMLHVSHVPDGLEGLAVAEVAEAHLKADKSKKIAAVYIARDDRRMASMEQALKFFSPKLTCLSFPAWDCVPYDRVSPNAEISARRMTALSRLAYNIFDAPVILLTSVNAMLQRVPSKESVKKQSWSAKPGNSVDMDDLIVWLETNGFLRTPTVREHGEYAVRGGIVDLFVPGAEEPVRLDFFGDTLESIRKFDQHTQRTVGQLRGIDLVSASEVVLTEDAISNFRRRYTSNFGATTRDDLLYQAISNGHRYQGIEHWLPYFNEDLQTLFDFTDDAPVILDPLSDDAITERLDVIQDHYAARRETLDSGLDQGVPYKPVEPHLLYLDREGWSGILGSQKRVRLSPFDVPETGVETVVNMGGKQGRTFAAERSAENVNVFDAVIEHIKTVKENKKRVTIACWTPGSAERMHQVLTDHEMRGLVPFETWQARQVIKPNQVGLTVLELESGFETDKDVVIGEQDILGDRLVRSKRRRKKSSDVLTEAASLTEGDIVVHIEHGIGRFMGLQTVDAAGAPHDCLEIHYAGGDKLFLPVENIELLSRYGSEDTEAQLDKLGGVAWQARKSKMKERIRMMADQLIKVAAERELRKAERITPPEGLYDEFVARFPFDETEDQFNAIEQVFDDMGSGRPMDRLICGDVGFGKTEVALRAAFIAAMNGRQVAVVVPTTLLARQHYKNFVDRFAGFPLVIEQASRLVSTKKLNETKRGLKDGSVDIVVGTHALLGKSVDFRDLGLLIIDEEQHFGVKHKERLKELRADVHVLTLSATPIPRTLQLALTGVRELSLIATPPVDRLAVRTFISPFDKLTIREALLRERYRGGQSFYVCPRVSDIAQVHTFLEEQVPEVKVAVAHGQMPAGQLDDIMTAFYDGKFDVLLSTTIVESGIDVPTANTLIVHRADMFGLSQLYQLRGRVGRSKTRAYALFTVPAKKTLTPTAERRLKVLQSLDTLGAGFQLASHDLDIRGAGNLLGEEQSGHVKEVGYELYQQMLEEAVASLRSGDLTIMEDKWSPQISIGTPVLIPDSYVHDLQLRLNLYRRLADLVEADEIDEFGSELTDRFGPQPEEVKHLLKIVYIKGLCRKANVEKIDAGPKGAVLAFRNNEFANPAGLVQYITEQGSLAKLRPDQKIFLARSWNSASDRLKGTAVIMTQLAKLAQSVT
ncbi:transcription-repair coupling factor [Cohaesibacter marisflavi]|uniref:Transcription-repair-coupling factor n=1 Tax=Cohaesibacter marisflavi TaxID=655353 RepID=A0A1I5I7L6_9HYPH|nr:transcription-repair coupling factor [Cohaesibacter marisflavi]SFO56658.1 transcription-repair coupling factor [Cohaesibacter marisflavi]